MIALEKENFPTQNCACKSADQDLKKKTCGQENLHLQPVLDTFFYCTKTLNKPQTNNKKCMYCTFLSVTYILMHICTNTDTFANDYFTMCFSLTDIHLHAYFGIVSCIAAF